MPHHHCRPGFAPTQGCLSAITYVPDGPVNHK
ncbi:hypothetical protein POX_c04624 [Penicillium oxalicum]|nr:hypothetical protein POX_c04624 [Penicillium oxalicum]KAI2791746.1 hypothetical protein POX_c04624 [Penicillium oxalicum]